MTSHSPNLRTMFAATLLLSVSGSLAQAEDEMVCVQNGLNNLGYLVGEADGVLGPRTRQRAAEINTDFKFGLQPLSAAHAEQWCAKLNEYVFDAEVHSGNRLASRPTDVLKIHRSAIREPYRALFRAIRFTYVFQPNLPVP